MQKILRAVAAFLLFAAPSATAGWLEARTGHFVIYIDDTEANARDFAGRLERFDLALRRLYGLPDDPDRHANPVRIFALRDRLFFSTCGCSGVLGYYVARIDGSAVVTAHMPGSDKKAQPGSWSSQAVLLREYGHHFMFSNYPLAYPYWFAEGFAEFNANVVFNEDGSITLGIPANYRAEALKSGARLSVEQFFEPNRYGFGSRRDMIYARGWLLTHYLMLDPRRRGQLQTYLFEMNRGNDSLTAARKAFGDLDKLYDELIAYGRGILAPPLRIPPPDKPIDVRIRALSKGEAAMIPIRTLLISGVSRSYMLGFATRAREAAEDYQDDPTVQATLAAAELLAGKLDRADAAADRALALQPANVEALVIKGRVAMRRAMEAKVTDPRVLSAARGWFLKANRAEPNAPQPFYLYYRSFLDVGAKPNASAVKGLMRAHVLSPESAAIRLSLARQSLEDGDGLRAPALLQPIAFAPHRRTQENVARAVIGLIDTGKLTEAKAAMDPKNKDED